jgi:hypothetical protein
MKTFLIVLIPFFTYTQVKLPIISHSSQFLHFGNQGFGNSIKMQNPNKMNILYEVDEQNKVHQQNLQNIKDCLLYTSDAADEGWAV